jgi:SPP1 family predicted phage head-tail adaptor
MKAGALRERVTIEAETRTSNGQGGYKTGWTAFARAVPAEIIALSGDEALRLNIERSTSQYRVRMRRRAEIDAEKRLLWKGQVMAIKSVVPDPKEPQAMLLLTCEIGQGV